MDSTSQQASHSAVVMAGVPEVNNSLFHRVGFLVGDPAAWIQLTSDSGDTTTILLVRDIEMDRARRHAQVETVGCPADFAPPEGLSGDRETATAQAVAEYLRRNNVRQTVSDRSLPFLFVEMMRKAGIAVQCDAELGVRDRRAKNEREIEWLREAQRVTEQCVEMACRLIAKATAAADGVLHVDSQPLTSERVRQIVDVWLLERGYANPSSIIAGGPVGADCHDIGSGVLRTGQPVIVDIFPRNRTTRYHGDCTRTVVHGEAPDQLLQMHAAVVAAKQAGERVCRAGTPGQAVHEATTQVIEDHGYQLGLPSDSATDDYCAMVHGTGHGIGLDVHEPPLLDRGGPALVVGDALTIEPGLYTRSMGGVRVEDMVIVCEDRCENLNSIPEGLNWDT